jgi:hypothetical protein
MVNVLFGSEQEMTEYDLVKIREALEKPSLLEAIQAMEMVLKDLGYTKQISLEIRY